METQFRIRKLIRDIEDVQSLSSFFAQDTYLNDLRDELYTQLMNLEEGITMDYGKLIDETESLGRRVAFGYVLNALEAGEPLKHYI